MIIRLAFASSEEWKVKSEECWLKNASRFSSFPFLFSLLSLLSPNFVRLWSVWMDSNHRPRAYQARALTTWATNRSQVVPVPSSHGSLSGGGDDGIRTHDPLLAGQVLSQLSYTPISMGSCFSKDPSSFRLPDPCKLNNKRSVLAVHAPVSSLTRMTDPWKSVPVSIERRWSSRTFRYGYLVTT